MQLDLPKEGREMEVFEEILASKFPKFGEKKKKEFTDPRNSVTPKEDKYQEPHTGIS